MLILLGVLLYACLVMYVVTGVLGLAMALGLHLLLLSGLVLLGAIAWTAYKKHKDG